MPWSVLSPYYIVSHLENLFEDLWHIYNVQNLKWLQIKNIPMAFANHGANIKNAHRWNATEGVGDNCHNERDCMYVFFNNTEYFITIHLNLQFLFQARFRAGENYNNSS